MRDHTSVVLFFFTFTGYFFKLCQTKRECFSSKRRFPALLAKIPLAFFVVTFRCTLRVFSVLTCFSFQISTHIDMSKHLTIRTWVAQQAKLLRAL